MKPLKLYRGITVSEIEVQEIIEDIRKNGLHLNSNQTWGGFIWKDLKKDLDKLYSKENLTREDTLPASTIVKTRNGSRREYTEGENSLCFADIEGAKYYATKHNVTKDKTVALLIETEIKTENIAIDGRDFLYTVFQHIDSKNIEKTNRQLLKMKKVFGNKIEVYFEKIIKHPNSERLAICDLITLDNEIIIEHSKNREIIGGRYNTIFKSAFFGKVPILGENIQINVIKEDLFNSTPTLTLKDILEQ